MRSLAKLASIGSDPICRRPPNIAPTLMADAGVLGEQLGAILDRKNGFLAFESALHVLGAGNDCKPSVVDLNRWNALTCWRAEYEDQAMGCVFFAEDLFGEQFAIRGDRVVQFDPETGETAEFAEDLEQWAAVILERYEFVTGFPLAHAWQVQNGPLPLGKRLLPKVPFVLGGAYELDNLVATDAIESMRMRARLAKRLRGLPDGAKLKFSGYE